MNAAIQGRSRYLDGLPPIELWGVSRGPAPVPFGGAGIINSATPAKRARRALKKAARKAGWSLKGYEQHLALQPK